MLTKYQDTIESVSEEIRETKTIRRLIACLETIRYAQIRKEKLIEELFERFDENDEDKKQEIMRLRRLLDQEEKTREELKNKIVAEDMKRIEGILKNSNSKAKKEDIGDLGAFRSLEDLDL
uniref:BMERB domain-containing protein n=1 Tax=Caenorhabditis tropicalis TaxID=1561998 RepID=A0A1I7UH45_9PELO